MAFFGLLGSLGIFMVMAGPAMLQKLTNMMRIIFLTSIKEASNPEQVTTAIASIYLPAVQSLALLGGTVFLAVLLMQMIQIRGLLFSTHPLKPDFSRINPGKGLKRLFSLRTLKEALKNIFKMSVYLACTYFMITYCLRMFSPTISDVNRLIIAMHGSGLRLLFMFTFLALIFAAIDQVIVRREFLKQMRMSRSEVKREVKDREGEPRMKQKRKQLHTEFTQQTQAIGNLAGSDVLIVNPHHYAVGLIYDTEHMEAPKLTTKGRNRFALMLKQKAVELGIPIIESPVLARALFRNVDIGKEVGENHYHDIANVYLKLYRIKNAKDNQP